MAASASAGFAAGDGRSSLSRRSGALDTVEGSVWSVERQGRVDFIVKYVRPAKVDGSFLPELNGGEACWNWQPATK
jgi:hypothetical protein